MNPTQTVLLADDDENDILLLRMAFAKAGLAKNLLCVKNGAEAIQYLNGEGAYADRERYPFPCLMLLDLKMPFRNGFEVLNWIRAQETLKHLVVTVLTASKDEGDVKRAYDLCVNSYLVKPNSAGRLDDLVKRLKEYWLELNISPHCPPPQI